MKPSRMRHAVLFVVCLVYLITYLDRVNLSVAAPNIIGEFGLSKLQWGLVLSVFSWTYTMGQVPIGMLADKFGARVVLAIIVLAWGGMTAVTGLVWGLGSLIAARLAFGLCEAGAFPAATRALAPWIPKTERGFAQGVTHAFARFGGAITPVVAAIAIEYLGWRNMFYVFASFAIAWGGFWYFWYRDTPKEFQNKWGGINQAEIDYIEEGRSNAQKIKLPFRVLLKSRNMWALALSYPCYCYVVWIYMTWLPQFLAEAHGLTTIKMGIFASLPLLAGTVGDTLGGWLSDRIWRHTGRGKFSRRVVAMTGLLVAAAFMIPGAMASTPGWAIFFLACALFGQEMAVGVYWAVCLDIGHEYSGTVSGLMNSMGGVTSAMSPLVFAAILQFTGSWVYPFVVASGLLVIGALLWLRIDPEKSLVEELDLKGLAAKSPAR